jgi:hypothetical protein
MGSQSASEHSGAWRRGGDLERIELAVDGPPPTPAAVPNVPKMSPKRSLAADPVREPFFRFFFEAYGLALRRPDDYASFLDRVVCNWIDPRAPIAATLELALLSGLLPDLTRGDRDRIERSLALYRRRRGS